jgi:hypothetical protein
MRLWAKWTFGSLLLIPILVIAVVAVSERLAVFHSLVEMTTTRRDIRVGETRQAVYAALRHRNLVAYNSLFVRYRATPLTEENQKRPFAISCDFVSRGEWPQPTKAVPKTKDCPTASIARGDLRHPPVWIEYFAGDTCETLCFVLCNGSFYQRITFDNEERVMRIVDEPFDRRCVPIF